MEDILILDNGNQDLILPMCDRREGLQNNGMKVAENIPFNFQKMIENGMQNAWREKWKTVH
jgi:hypothetical protein